jgi:hypothetical protein
MDMVLIVCPHMVLFVCFPLFEHARGQPGIATAGCSAGATRVEILAVQRSAMQDRQYRNGRVDLRGIFSPAHRLLALSPPLPHGGAQRPEGTSAASAGAVSHGSCLASGCPCVLIEGRRTPEGRKQQVPAYRVWPGSASTSARCSGHMPPRASECGREAPRRARAAAATCLPVRGSRRQCPTM